MIIYPVEHSSLGMQVLNICRR